MAKFWEQQGNLEKALSYWRASLEYVSGESQADSVKFTIKLLEAFISKHNVIEDIMALFSNVYHTSVFDDSV